MATQQSLGISLIEMQSGAHDEELTTLWQMSRMQSHTRYERLIWAADSFFKAHSDTPSVRAYKRLDEITRGY